MQSKASTVVVLGTGGTIAGTSVPGDGSAYVAAQIGVTQLVSAIPALAGQSLECEQVAQVDSKDMGFAVWLQLAQRVTHHLARDEVAGIVVTHGSDTLEETAYFLQRVIAPRKPVVLTAAMRPATSAEADGPRNLVDAVRVAHHVHASGVVAVMAGTVHGAADVRKAHASRLDAFGSGDAGPLARLDGERMEILRAWPQAAEAFGITRLPAQVQDWPRVEIIVSHAGTSARGVQALCADGAMGLVVAATGGGTVHQELETALVEAQRRGVRVLRATRCAEGQVTSRPNDALESAGELNAVKARIELMLRLMELRSGHSR